MSNAPSVTYRVSLRPSQHELAITVQLRGSLAEGEIRLAIPTWVPGDYSFAPQARDLFRVRATCDVTGAELPLRRDGWQGYLVSGGTGSVTVQYSAVAWGDDLSESAGLLDNEWGIVLGARFLRVPDYLGPCEVHYTLPPGWEIHHPSGAERLGEATAWRYPSYEIILDTPVVVGHFARFRREVAGTPVWFVFVDRGVGFARQVGPFLDAVCKVVASFGEMYGSFPFADYTFVLSLNPNYDWGLEHLSSTMCGLGPDVFVDEDQFKIGVRVCAHELFHAWNVRRCRPSPLGQLETQLQSGAFTEGLWVAEGFTRYYEFLSCARAGVYTASQFFSNLVGYHRHLTVQPAYERVSAADSSYASYLNHQKYAGRANNAIDYYDKGMLIAFGLDATLRTEVEGGSLDRSFAEFYRRFVGFGPEHAGYSTRDVLRFFAEEHAPLGAQLAAAVEHPGGLQTPEQLCALGFAVEVAPWRCLGLVFADEVSATIADVLDDSAAGGAGLAPGDTIISIDGYAFSVAALRWVAGQDAPVTLEVQRGHRRLSFLLTPAPRARISSVVWRGGSAERQRISQWLGQETLDLVEGQALDLSFYENFHGVDVVV